MSKAENTRKFIIEKAAPVFNRKGYAGTSLSDLVEATGLTKGAIYGNFENKDEVATEVFRYQAAGLNRRIAEFIRDKETSGEKLHALTDYYRTNWKRIFAHGGCPVLNAAVEADDHATFLKKHVQNSLTRWANSLSVLIKEGQKNGEFKKNIDPEYYAYTIITMLEGGVMMGKIMNDFALFGASLDRIDTMIDTEMKK